MGLLKLAAKILKNKAGDLTIRFARHDQEGGGINPKSKGKTKTHQQSAAAGMEPLPAAHLGEWTSLGTDLMILDRYLEDLVVGSMGGMTAEKEQALGCVLQELQQRIKNMWKEKTRVEGYLNEMAQELRKRQEEKAQLEAEKVLKDKDIVRLQREVAELKAKQAASDGCKKQGSSTIILGRGGFGLVRQDEYPVGPDGEEVYQPVAVKTVYNNRDDCMREGEIMEKLSHCNIPLVYDYYQEPTIVMELVKGKTIYQLVRESPEVFTSQSYLTIFQQVFSALAHMASKSVAHRDIKPANIMIIDDDSYTVKIVDFGLAVDVDDEEDIPRLQSCCGTPAYIAPEMIRLITTGEHMKPKLMPKLDVWSAGVMLFELLTGVVPFDVEAMDKAKKRDDKRKAAKELEERTRCTLQSQRASSLKPAAYKPADGDSALDEALLWQAVDGAIQFEPAHRSAAQALRDLLLTSTTAKT